MPDDQKPADGTPPPADDKMPPADAGKKPDTKGAGDSDKGDNDEDWLESLPASRRAYVKRLQTENIERRKDNKEKGERIAALENEKAEKEKEELQKRGEFQKLYEQEQAKNAKMRDAAARAELKAYAQSAGIIDLSDVGMMDIGDAKFNDAGEIVNAEKIVEKYKQSKPHWFKAAAGKEEGATKPDPKPSGSAKPEPTANVKPGSKPDFSSMSKAEVKQYEREFLASLR